MNPSHFTKTFRRILNNLSNQTDCQDACDYLTKLGFKFLKQGCESEVYTKKGLDVVIKIMFDPHYSMVKALTALQNFAGNPLFADSFSIDCKHFAIIVQEKMDEVIGDNPLFGKRANRYNAFLKLMGKKYPSVGDYHAGNIGVKNGKMKVFDFADMKATAIPAAWLKTTEEKTCA